VQTLPLNSNYPSDIMEYKIIESGSE